MTQDDFNILIEAIFAGRVSILTPEKAQMLYEFTFNELFIAIEEGWGVIEAPAFDIVRRLETNVNLFSGAKTWKNIWDTQKLLFDKNGFKRSFSEFYPLAEKTMTIYNKWWLDAEYNTTIAQARQAENWINNIDANKEILPLLQYQTVGDQRVRPAHAALDGIIKPVDDPFWDTFYPANSFRCRCVANQITSGRTTRIGEKKLKELTEGIPPVFRMNAGKDKLIFKQNHPYFTTKGLPRPRVAELFKLQRKNNFGYKKPVTILDL
jgi:SPP1 gp7 family putative phage head morphogenesis protein